MKKLIVTKFQGGTRTINEDFNLQDVIDTPKTKWVSAHENDYLLDISDVGERVISLQALYDELTAAALKAGLKPKA